MTQLSRPEGRVSGDNLFCCLPTPLSELRHATSRLLIQESDDDAHHESSQSDGKHDPADAGYPQRGHKTGAHGHQGWCPRAAPHDARFGRPPRRDRAKAHHEEQQKRQRHGEAVEERLPDADLGTGERLEDQGVCGPYQHHEGVEREQEIVEKECPFAGDKRRESAGCRHEMGAGSKEGERAHQHQDEEPEQRRADR